LSSGAADAILGPPTETTPLLVVAARHARTVTETLTRDASQWRYWAMNALEQYPPTPTLADLDARLEGGWTVPPMPSWADA
jgi:hypothetical protein